MNSLPKYGLILLTTLSQPDRNELISPEAAVISTQTQKVRGFVDETTREASLPTSTHILPEILDRNKETNTEESFWNTGSNLEAMLRQRKMWFNLSEQSENPGTAALIWNMGGEVLYCFTLPNPEDIDLNYQFNVTFQEYMREGSKWMLADQEVLRSNSQVILNGKVLEVLGFDHSHVEPEEE